MTDKKGSLKIIFSIILSAIIIYVFFRKIPLTKIKETISYLTLNGIILYIFFSLAGTIFRTLRYKILLSNKIGFTKLFLITLVRNFSVDLLPARTASFFFYTYFTNNEGIKIEEAGISFIISMIYDVLSLTLLLSIAFLYFNTNNNILMFYSLLLGIFASAIIILYLTIPIINQVEKLGFINKSKKIKLIINNVKTYFIKHNSNKERVNILCLSLIIRFLKYISLFILFKELTKTVLSIKNLSIFSFGLSATELSSIIPIQGIAGFGTWELSFKYIFDFLKTGIKDPFLIGFIIHTTTQIWEYLIGLISFFIIFYKKRDKTN